MADISAPVVEGGRWVRIVGLQSEAGQKLNHKVAKVLKKDKAAAGRYLLSIDGLDQIDGTKGKSIKDENFVDIRREELVQVCRLPAYGESSVVDVQQPKVLLYPKDHSMFTTSCNPEGNCPVMNMVEVPLMIVKTKPYTDLSASGAADNVMATYLQINVEGGIAPPRWQSNVGPVLVYRPGARDLGFYDMWAIHSFLSNLLDSYGDPGFNPNAWLNSKTFQHRIRQENPPGDVKQMNITLDIHSMVNKCYKQLRKEGVSTQEAMAQARREFGLDREPEIDPAQQVGAMFGLS